MQNCEGNPADDFPLRERKKWKALFLLSLVLWVSNTCSADEMSCPNLGLMIGSMPIPVMAEVSIESNCYRLFYAGDIGGGQVIAFDYSINMDGGYSLGLGFGEAKITRRANLNTYQLDPLVTAVHSTFKAYGPTIRLDYRTSIQGSFYYSRFDIIGGLYGFFNGSVHYDHLDEVIDEAEKERLRKVLKPEHNNYSYPFGLMVSFGLYL